MNALFRQSLLFVLVASLPNFLWAEPFAAAFTYQGRLRQNGSPAEGLYDFRFRLYDAPLSGNQVGPLLSHDAVAVSNGLFMVELDFGSGAYADGARWLHISVQTNGGTRFTSLSPRQALTPAPAAHYALEAGLASFAASSGSLAGSNLTAAAEGVLTFTARSIAIESSAFTNMVTGAATRVVATDSREIVGGQLSVAVGGTYLLTAGGDVTATLGRHLYSAVLGDCELGVGTNLSLGMGKVLTVNAGDEILLQTGDASLRMRKNGDITIRGNDILVEGSGKFLVHTNASPAFTLAGAAIHQPAAGNDHHPAAKLFTQRPRLVRERLNASEGAVGEVGYCEAVGHRPSATGLDELLEALRMQLAQQAARLAALEQLLGKDPMGNRTQKP